MKRILFGLLLISISIVSFANSHLINPKNSYFIDQKPKLIDIFRNMDVSILALDDQEKVKEYLVKKNQEIIKYIKTEYPGSGEELSFDIDMNDNAILIYGMTCALFESNNFESFPTESENMQTRLANLPPWLECTFSVLGASAGINQIIAELSTFSWGSAWTVVKFVVKKYGLGWFGTIGALYAVATTCF